MKTKTLTDFQICISVPLKSDGQFCNQLISKHTKKALASVEMPFLHVEIIRK